MFREGGGEAQERPEEQVAAAWKCGEDHRAEAEVGQLLPGPLRPLRATQGHSGAGAQRGRQHVPGNVGAWPPWALKGLCGQCPGDECTCQRRQSPSGACAELPVLIFLL